MGDYGYYCAMKRCIDMIETCQDQRFCALDRTTSWACVDPVAFYTEAEFTARWPLEALHAYLKVATSPPWEESIPAPEYSRVYCKPASRYGVMPLAKYDESFLPNLVHFNEDHVKEFEKTLAVVRAMMGAATNGASDGKVRPTKIKKP
jgi:hypothetical protein